MSSFESLGEFSQHLEAIAGDHEEMSHALHEIGEHLEHKAKEKIGEYQEGWAELKPGTEADKARHGYKTDAPLLRTGELKESIGHTVHEHEKTVEIGSSDDVMVYQEFGTSKLPPRPVFETLAAENHAFLTKTVAKHAQKAMEKAQRGGRGRR